MAVNRFLKRYSHLHWLCNNHILQLDCSANHFSDKIPLMQLRSCLSCYELKNKKEKKKRKKGWEQWISESAISTPQTEIIHSHITQINLLHRTVLASVVLNPHFLNMIWLCYLQDLRKKSNYLFSLTFHDSKTPLSCGEQV